MPSFLNDTTDSDEVAIHGIANGSGVFGESRQWYGVAGISTDPNGAAGVYGKGEGAGVVGEGVSWHGVAGISTSTTGGSGVYGEGQGVGVTGIGRTWIGVYAETNGTENGPSAVLGEGKTHGVGVKGHASGEGIAAVAGYHLTGAGPGIYGEGSPAGHFNGNVIVTGDIQLPNADCAEDFDVMDGEAVEPGTVLVLTDDERLRPSERAYDRCVAGVVSGAGTYRPGIVLDRQHARPGRRPVALLGKVYCMVDARYGAIAVGDLLTTSPTVGHAMKAADPRRAFGAVLGKALRPMPSGRGLLPILIALQ